MLQSGTMKTTSYLDWKLTFDERIEALVKQSICCYRNVKDTKRGGSQERGIDNLFTCRIHTWMCRDVGRALIIKLPALYIALVVSTIRKSLVNKRIRLKMISYNAKVIRKNKMLESSFYNRCIFDLDPTMLHVSSHFQLLTYGCPALRLVHMTYFLCILTQKRENPQTNLKVRIRTRSMMKYSNTSTREVTD